MENTPSFFQNYNWFKWRRFGAVARKRPLRILTGNPTSLTDNFRCSLHKVKARKVL
jgi:hypothetical protein